MHPNASLPALFAPPPSLSTINEEEFELLQPPPAPTTQPLANPGRLLALAHLATVPLPSITAPGPHHPETQPGTLVPSSSASEGRIFRRPGQPLTSARYPSPPQSVRSRRTGVDERLAATAFWDTAPTTNHAGPEEEGPSPLLYDVEENGEEEDPRPHVFGPADLVPTPPPPPPSPPPLPPPPPPPGITP